ncbi:MAG TPA: GTP-binding protein [Nitrospirota bacterium]|nr:GTP-binding protein [Nitrospirota bacterium]
MKTTVVCGLLGSGKTTFIRNFVKGMTEKVVVLVNDFGTAGIDGEIFSAGGIESIELPSGCVCCTLKFDLITTIQKVVKEFSPEHLLIEPSGVASPSGVLEALASAGAALASVVGIIDATEFTELYDSGLYGRFFEDQITCADVILVNKTDLAREEMTVEAIRRIESINPQAVLFRTVNAEIREPMPEIPHMAREQRSHHAHFNFSTMTVRLGKALDFASFNKRLNELARGKYGTVVRAKALVQTEKGPYRFDIVFGKVDSAPFERDIEDSRIVIIGEGLKQEAFRSTIS